MNDDQPETYYDLDPTVRGRAAGLFEAARMLDIKAEFHNDELDSTKNEDHHRAARNTAANMAENIRREAINTILDPQSSRYYHDDKDRAESD